jgi:hypothetical protein
MRNPNHSSFSMRRNYNPCRFTLWALNGLLGLVLTTKPELYIVSLCLRTLIYHIDYEIQTERTMSHALFFSTTLVVLFSERTVFSSHNKLATTTVKISETNRVLYNTLVLNRVARKSITSYSSITGILSSITACMRSASASSHLFRASRLHRVLPMVPASFLVPTRPRTQSASPENTRRLCPR